jgi:rhamnosyltransferase
MDSLSLEGGKKSVLILMACYNGVKFIDAQMKSIQEQNDCSVTILISVDKSNDKTFEHIKNLQNKFAGITLLSYGAEYKSASANFYRLIVESDIEGYDYIAFSDQDDIWFPNKLNQHIKLLNTSAANAVSSNVLAFWPGGGEKLIDKAQPQRDLDFLFESAGPGCTFLMTPWLVNKVREQLLDKNSQAKKVILHDWLTYAICRANEGRWIIDPKPSLYYRQHSNNVVGANVGLKAKWARLQKLRQGWYRKEVIKIAQVCNSIAPDNSTDKLLVLLQTKNLISQLKLLAYVSKARRSLVDRFLLAISIVVGLF